MWSKLGKDRHTLWTGILKFSVKCQKNKEFRKDS